MLIMGQIIGNDAHRLDEFEFIGGYSKYWTNLRTCRPKLFHVARSGPCCEKRRSILGSEQLVDQETDNFWRRACI